MMESGNKILGNNIKAYRTAKGWSQEELAHLAGMTPAHLGHIERGEGNPTLLTLLSISKALQIDLSELVKSNAEVAASASTLQLDKLQEEFSELPENRQTEVYSIIKTMLSWNKKKE